jgi:hypothetical protein
MILLPIKTVSAETGQLPSNHVAKKIIENEELASTQLASRMWRIHKKVREIGNVPSHFILGAGLDGLFLRLCRIDCGLGELDLRHDDSSETSDSKSHMGATRPEAGSSFGKHRHMMDAPKSLINLL